MRSMKTLLAGALAGMTTLVVLASPAAAQSVGYVTGIPGPDPAYDDEFGWGPAYRPETTFAQPGTPLTPGQIAAIEHYRRTGRPVYPPIGAYQPEAVAPGYGYVAPRRIVRAPAYEKRRAAKRKRVVERVR